MTILSFAQFVCVVRNGKSKLFPSVAILDDRTYGSRPAPSRIQNTALWAVFCMVGGQGFEPWKADANRFTVCPV